MFTIKGGLAEKLGFEGFSINLDTADLNEVDDDEASIVITNPRLARSK